MNILIIEDDKGIAALLALVIERAGYTSSVWTSDFEALAEQGPWSEIDVVLCDQALDDFDGKELFYWLRDNHPNIKRIMITGSSLTTETDASADRVLIKPASPHAIIDAIENVS